LRNYSPKSRIIIISNRLPLVIKKTVDGKIRFERGAGGLVTAMAPVLERKSGVWIGWPGAAREAGDEERIRTALGSGSGGYDIRPVPLDARELKNYYEGFANSVLWPLFHGFTGPCQFQPEYWDTYCQVNEKFSKMACATVRQEDFIWVHDYQLILVGERLREKGLENKLGFFFTFPFLRWNCFPAAPGAMSCCQPCFPMILLDFIPSSTNEIS